MVAIVGIQPIVATLAVLVGGRGLALVFANGRLTEIFNSTLVALGTNRVFGIPINVLITSCSSSPSASS
jgi:ribose transport system permease protein